MGLGIKIRDLQLHHVSGSQISCEIRGGEMIGLTGANGAGKSDMLRYLAGVRRTKTMGEIVMDGLDPFHARDLEKLHRRIGFACQSPEETMVFSRIVRDAAFGPENQAVEPEIIRKRWEGLRSRLLDGIPEGQRFEELSGGQQQRAALVSVLMLRAPLLLLDEPLSMLGQEEGREVLKLILSLAKRNEQTLILVSHDPEVLKRMDRVFVLKDGKLRERKARAIEQEADEAGAEEDISAAKTVNKVEDAGIGRKKAAATGDKEEAGIILPVFKKENAPEEVDPEGEEYTEDPEAYGGKVVTRGPEWILQKKPESKEPLVTIRNVSFRYGKNSVLQHFSAEVCPGGIYRITGGTGSGKSTLCKLMNGTLLAGTGDIRVDQTKLPLAGSRMKWSILAGRRPTPLAPVRRFVGYVMQSPEDQLFERTVLRDVMYGARCSGRPEETAKKDAVEALKLLRVPDTLWKRKPEKLSGGEKRRVAIAGILAMKPRVLVLDEPFAGLDPEGCRIVKQMIEDYADRGNAVVITGHEAE